MNYSLSITIVYSVKGEGGGAWDPLIAPMIFITYLLIINILRFSIAYSQDP